MFGQKAGFRLPTNVQRYYEADLWASYYFVNAAALSGINRDLYAAQVGGAGAGYPAGTTLSISATNMVEQSRIASGLAYTVRQVAIELLYDDNYPVVGADLRNVLNNCAPVWRFLNTTVEISTVSLIGQGGGIFGTTADTGAVEGGLGGSRIALNNGAGSTWVYHELPVLLPANTTFALQLQFGTLASAVDGGTNSSDLIIRSHLVGVATSAVPEG